MLELLAHRLLVEHAEDGVFAVDRGHDGDAEVDEAALVADAEAAVLGHALLGDVELAHDLDAAEDGAVMLAGDGRHGLLQHAVDAVLDVHRIVVAFDVNVGGAALERGEDGGVDQANDGADVFVSLVSFSMEMFSSEFSSPVSTSKVRPSLASSSTRCDCSVFLSRSVICESVATRGDDAMRRAGRRSRRAP